MKKAFGPIVLLHYFASSLVIASGCLMLTMTEGGEMAIYIFYTGVQFLDGFVFALGGSALTNSSLCFKDSAYNFEWYKCDTKSRKAVLLLIMRAQKKISITVPFFEASLETFVGVNLYSRNEIAISLHFESSCRF